MRATSPYTYMQRGVWNEINIRMIINDVPSEGTGAANGILELYRNDTLIRKMENIVYRRYSDQYFDYYFNDILTRANAERDEDYPVLLDDYIVWREDDHMNYRTSRERGTVISTPDIGYDNP